MGGGQLFRARYHEGMYRDDLEALRARVASLEAALEAEQRGRDAAEAEARAARARTEELRLILKRLGAGEPTFLRRHGPTVLALLLALAAVGAFVWQRMDRIRDQVRIARLELASERQAQRHRRPQPVAPEPVSAEAAPGRSAAYLVANTYPFARVLVDGKDTGLTTPIALRSKIALAPGAHRVTFVVDGQRFHSAVNAAPGETVRIFKRLPVSASD